MVSENNGVRVNSTRHRKSKLLKYNKIIYLNFLQLIKCQDVQCGLLVGLVPSNKDRSLVIVGVTSCNNVSELTVTGEQIPLPNLKEGSQFIRQHYPAGTDVVGLFCRVKWMELSETQLKELHKGMQDHGINKVGVSCHVTFM